MIPTATERAATATNAPAATNTAPAATAPAVSTQTGIVITLVAAYGASPGGVASVEAKVTPNAVCTLAYSTPSGTASEAEGLGQATADADGDVRWEWNISASTKTGSGQVVVTCGDASQTSNITIGP